MSIILRTAGLSIGSTIVLGEPQTGRTTWTINQLAGKKVLWVAMNNTGVIADTELLGEGSRLVLVSDLKSDIPKITKEDGFDTIVIDGFNYFIGLWFAANIGETHPTQQDWGKLSQAAKKLILDYRAIAPVYCIVDLEKDEEGQLQIATNRATAQGIMGLFDKKVRTAVKTEVKPDPKTQKVERKQIYTVFTGIDALTF